MVRRDMTVFDECPDYKKKKNGKHGLLDDPMVSSAVASDKIQKKLLDFYIDLLDPKILMDENIMPLDFNAINALLEFTPGKGGFLIPSSSNFHCLQNGRAIQLCAGQKILVTAKPGRVLQYCIAFAPAAYSTVAQFLRRSYNFEVDRVIKPSEHREKVDELLHDYRLERKFSGCLEKITKIDQLHAADYDHVSLKFNFLSRFKRNPVCYHFGSGDNVSGTLLGIAPYYSRVICIDPRLKPGDDYWNKTFDQVEIPAGVDVISDMAYGNDYGMLANDHAYYEKLYKMSKHRLVIVKIGLLCEAKIRGIPLRKPRPHNMELILKLDPDGMTMDQIYAIEAKKMMVANEERNIKMYRGELENRIKKHRIDQLDLARILKSNIDLPTITVLEKKATMGVGEMKLAKIGGGRGDRISQLNVAFQKLMKKKRKPKTYAVVPIVEGRIARSDPGFPDIELSAGAIFFSAQPHIVVPDGDTYRIILKRVMSR